MKLGIIVGSTRPGRVGIKLAEWLLDVASQRDGIDAALIDLARVNLPMYDEAAHPRFRKYQNAYTQSFSALIAGIDAFVIVTPEYNHNPPSALLNALTFLNSEWAYKPIAFMSYGGISGGLRAVQTLKLTMLALRTVPIFDGVVVPLVAQRIVDGRFDPTEMQVEAAGTVLTDLAKWSEALTQLR